MFMHIEPEVSLGNLWEFKRLSSRQMGMWAEVSSLGIQLSASFSNGVTWSY